LKAVVTEVQKVYPHVNSIFTDLNKQVESAVDLSTACDVVYGEEIISQVTEAFLCDVRKSNSGSIPETG
jgi:hypothetical protein